MRAINHALTGSLIGLVVGEPFVAIPLAILSHYLMDMIPHYADAYENNAQKSKGIAGKRFRYLLYADAALCGLLVLFLGIDGPNHWLLAAICAFAAAAPDLLSINLYRNALAGKKWKTGWYTTFASRIQWFERPIGAFVEIAWFIGIIVSITAYLRG